MMKRTTVWMENILLVMTVIQKQFTKAIGYNRAIYVQRQQDIEFEKLRLKRIRMIDSDERMGYQ